MRSRKTIHVISAHAEGGLGHPSNPDWTHISFCAFCGPQSKTQTGVSGKSAVAIKPGKVDRSPTGTAVSARMALMAAKGVCPIFLKRGAGLEKPC